MDADEFVEKHCRFFDQEPLSPLRQQSDNCQEQEVESMDESIESFQDQANDDDFTSEDMSH